MPRSRPQQRLVRVLAVIGGVTLVAVGSLGAPLSASAATHEVTNIADSGVGSLRDALSSATSGDTIEFNLPGSSTITLNSTITVPVGVTILGPGEARLTIAAASGGTFPLLTLAPTSPGQDYTVSDLTIDVGGNSAGAIVATTAVDPARNLSLVDDDFKNAGGGAVTVSGLTGALDIETSQFTGNSSAAAGAAVRADGISGAVTLHSDYFEGNLATRGGAVSVSGAGSFTIDGSEFDGNAATVEEGGAVFVDNVSGTITVKNGCGFRGNSARLAGGGLFDGGSAGALSVDDSLFDGNVSGVRDIADSVFVEGDGAGLNIAAATAPVHISATRFSNNQAPEGLGGGVYVGAVGSAASVTVDGSSFLDNAEFFGGGGMEVDGIETAAGPGLDVESSTFSGNSSAKGGSAGASIEIDQTSAPIRLVNSTLDEENDRPHNLPAFSVGAIEATSPGAVMLLLESDTIDGPGAVGILNAVLGRVQLDNSILQSVSSIDPAIQTFGTAPGVVSLSHDLVTTSKIPGLHDLGGNRFSVADMKLGALADNGGPTFTRLPASDSPAHNAGNAADVPPGGFDQRGAGFARVVQTIDIGAVEIQTLSDPATPTALPATGATIPQWMPVGGLTTVGLGLALTAYARARRRPARHTRA